jgi:hypothetical protein
MLIGSFYARYVTLAGIPDDWPDRVLSALWPLRSGLNLDAAEAGGSVALPDPGGPGT